MDIYILSSGRAGRQSTWHSLPESIKARTTIVIPDGEQHHYTKFPCLITPVGIKGIGPTRQWVIDRTIDKVVMLDDDLTFATRRTDNPTTFVPATDAELEAVFVHIGQLLDVYAHVGMSGREGANRNIARFMHNNRMVRILAFRANTLNDHSIRFDDMEFMEDFHVTLRLLRKGFHNCLINYMVQNQYGSNAAGGCSQYRTPEGQAQAAYKLHEKHPDFVKVIKKRTMSAWGWGERTDVVVQWKKALGADT